MIVGSHRGDEMAEHKDLKKVEGYAPKHRSPAKGQLASKTFEFGDINMVATDGTLLGTFHNTAVVMIQLPNSTMLDFSAETISHWGRGDVNFIAFLQDQAGHSLQQVSIPLVHSFCGTQDVLSQASTDAQWFDLTQTMSLSWSSPSPWAPC
jgi:predicted 3-demethylubiquinone-9 3-methyltransferase (glyoxalase superfamily)